MNIYCEEIEKLIEDLTWIPKDIDVPLDDKPIVDNWIELIEESPEIEFILEGNDLLRYAFKDEQKRQYNIDVKYQPDKEQNHFDEITEVSYYRVDVAGFCSRPQPIIAHRF